MTLALEFHTPWLLLGLAAAAIPVVLHLLSSVRAQEVYFPTLRFLRLSMEKTARRRRLEHWLLLLVRSLLLAALALAVAEPIMRATRGFWADARFAAVLVVDNSYSMSLRSAGSTRFERARREAATLLGGQAVPSQAEVLLTNGPGGEPALHANLDDLRTRLARAHLASGRAAIAQRVAQAVELLKQQSAPQKAIYIFSDMQRVSFEDLLNSAPARQAGIPLMLVDCADKPPVNVGISDLRIIGRAVVDQRLEFSATLVNSSPTDKVVEVWLQIDARPVGEPVRKVLQQAGAGGDRATVRFHHRFTAPGTHVGQVAIDQADDLEIDNVRRFSLDVAGRIGAVLVRGRGAGAMDAGMMLQMALDPYAGTPLPWSVRLRTVQDDQFAEAALGEAQAVFLADVPSFTPEQAGAIVRFVKRGGSAVFFLGPSANVDNYNQRFVQSVSEFGGLLPARIDKPVGNVGVAAAAVSAVKNLRHPYLADLYETPADYPDVLVQRYYRLAGNPAGFESALTAPDGEPIVSCKAFGAGRVVLFATTASPEWNNLATTPLLLPMVTRICLEAGGRLGGDNTYLVGTPVAIRPQAAIAGRAAVNVTLPDGAVEVLPLGAGAEGPSATFAKTDQVGTYRWEVAGAAPNVEGARGAFATNIDGAESDLAASDPAAIASALKPADVYFGKTLDDVHTAAAAAAAGDNLWDRLLALVILLLVTEAVLANRFRRGAEPVPAHLNPRLS